MTTFSDFNKGQQSFIAAMARRKLVDWCHHLMMAQEPDGTICFTPGDGNELYVEYAMIKKWLSKPKNGRHKILAAGWNAAAGLIKR